MDANSGLDVEGREEVVLMRGPTESQKTNEQRIVGYKVGKT
jgi:hypothetical protein